MAQANPTTPVTMVNLDLIEDPKVRDVIRNLARQLEAVYGQTSQVMNMNLARTVSAAGPNPPTVADGESIVWIRTDISPAQPYIVSRTGGTLYLWQAAQTMAVPGTSGGGGTPPPPSAPVVQSFSPLTGPVGTQVAITGSGFTGATSVLFSGVSATFTVVNDTRINATVPNGATSGVLRVITPAGSGSSAVAFQVTGTVSSGPPQGAGLSIQGSAVCTFHSIGLYWQPKDANGAAVTPIANPAQTDYGPAVAVRYAKLTDTAWKRAQDMWYDSRDTSATAYGRPAEARGSIVEVQSATQWVVQFGLYDAAGNITWVAENRPVTWSELGEPIPVGGYGPVEGPTKISTLSPGSVQYGGTRSGGSATAAHVCNQSGTPGAWTVYDMAAQTAQAPNSFNNFAVVINGSYMILRNLNLRGGESALYIQPGSHDVLIERNDFSDWGTPRSGTHANYNLTDVAPGQTFQRADIEDGGIKIPHPSYGDSSGTKRIIVQRNKFHNPRYGSNAWDNPLEGFGGSGAGGDLHPDGCSPLCLYPSGGNHVIRYNETFNTVDGTRSGAPSWGKFWVDGLINGNFNDSIGGIGPDCDIYKNIIMHAMDDGCELDGGGINTRFWKNYIDFSATGVSSTPAYLGPVYIWRNVYNRCRKYYSQVWGQETDRLVNFKLGQLGATDGSGLSNGGRRYIYHNTALQFPSGSWAGAAAGTFLGCRNFAVGTGAGPIMNTIFRNNIGETDRGFMIDTGNGIVNSSFGWDLTQRGFAVTDVNGVVVPNRPSYQTGSGALALWTGLYRLNPNQPGHGDAVRLPNFNDQYTIPDRGADQDGTPAMDFGTEAQGA